MLKVGKAREKAVQCTNVPVNASAEEMGVRQSRAPVCNPSRGPLASCSERERNAGKMLER